MRGAVFLGSKRLGLKLLAEAADADPSIRWTVIHPDDKADARSCLDEFASFAKARQLDLTVVDSPAAFRAAIAGLDARIGVVCGWYWMLSPADLAAFPDGLWGIHNSLLPKFRGNAPLVWSILAGEQEIGSTVFRISAGMDDGQVLMQVRLHLGTEEDVADALRQIEDGLLSDFGAKWRALLAGEAQLQTQDESQATWCGLRTDDDGAIDWSRPAHVLHDFIRAQAPPYPCAWTRLGDQKLRIVKAGVAAGVFYGTPGQVLLRGPGGVLVSCGNNTALEVRLLMADGSGETVRADQILKSLKSRLGP